MRKTVLILSHQGYSFLEDIAVWCRENDIIPVILSSSIPQNSEERIPAILKLSEHVIVTSKPSLCLADVRNAIEAFAAKNLNPRAVVSVWEGYRELMAFGNAQLGGNDIPPGSIGGAIDKLSFRLGLKRKGLSGVNAVEANERTLDSWMDEGKPGFVKPRRGLGSYGTFKLNAKAKENLRELRRQMGKDIEYDGVFQENQEFILEDYIPGKEFSFETIALDGKAFFLGIHEKLDVEETNSTTLENLCVSPPVSLTKRNTDRGMRFVGECLKAMGLDRGLFHVEAKWDPAMDRWELIEINPRVGGALIKESVNQRHRGISLLGLWIETLLVHDASEMSILLKKLEKLEMESRNSEVRTLFRVFFGTPGKVIGKIGPSSHSKPDILKIHFRPGQPIPHAEREVFLGQALWSFPRRLRKDEIQTFTETSKKALEIEYV